MEQTKEKEKKQWKEKVGKARGSSIIKNLKGFLKEFQVSGKDHNLITESKLIPSSPEVLKDPKAPTLKTLVGS